MRLPYETVADFRQAAELLRQHPYGVIEVADGQFRRVLLRKFPKIVTGLGIALFGQWRHRHYGGDRVLLYYNQPRRFRNFLVLKYVVSARGTQYGTLVRAMAVLDEIARLKRSDALLCDVANWRVSPRLMARGGWQPHCPSRWHHHYIKRFYGTYPAAPIWLRTGAETTGGLSQFSSDENGTVPFATAAALANR